MLTLRAYGKGWPSCRAFFQRRRMIREITCSGTPSRVLKVCAATKRKKIIGSQRIIEAIVLAVLRPALRSVRRFGCENMPVKLAGPSFEAKANTVAASKSSAQKIQIRLKSSSDKSQRAWTSRELSMSRPMTRPGRNNPLCHPQKTSAAPSNRGGGFMSVSPALLLGAALVVIEEEVSCQFRQPFFYFASLQNVELIATRANRPRLNFGRRHWLGQYQSHDRNPHTLQSVHEVSPGFIPSQQDTNAAADRFDMVQNQVFEITEPLILAWLDRGQDLQHLIRKTQAAAGGKTVRFRSHEQQVEQ